MLGCHVEKDGEAVPSSKDSLLVVSSILSCAKKEDLASLDRYLLVF